METCGFKSVFWPLCWFRDESCSSRPEQNKRGEIISDKKESEAWISELKIKSKRSQGEAAGLSGRGQRGESWLVTDKTSQTSLSARPWRDAVYCKRHLPGQCPSIHDKDNLYGIFCCKGCALWANKKPSVCCSSLLDKSCPWNSPIGRPKTGPLSAPRSTLISNLFPIRS